MTTMRPGASFFNGKGRSSIEAWRILGGNCFSQVNTGKAAGFAETEADSRGRAGMTPAGARTDRKSTRLNSSHQIISYAVFCLKKKKKKNTNQLYLKKKKNKKKKKSIKINI